MNLWHIVPNLDQLSVSVQQNTSTDYAGVDMRQIIEKNDCKDPRQENKNCSVLY